MAKSDEIIADKIMSEKQMESDAMRAKQILHEYSQWMEKAQAFVRDTGNQPQDPINFCRNVILTYGMKKLESGIITLS